MVSYDELLDWFWKLHDPTTLNQQGNDFGTQYRSVIFVHNQEQKAAATESKQKAKENFDKPIVTEISEASEYFEAKNYH